jgi:RNA polymerase sigma factor (TIGR02999 family)
LLPLVYEELRKLAAARMANERPGQTLQPTALVHEAWLRLGGDQQPRWQNRAHFFGAAAEAMRRILIHRARKRQVRASSGLAAPEELHESRIELRVPEAELWNSSIFSAPRRDNRTCGTSSGFIWNGFVTVICFC